MNIPLESGCETSSECTNCFCFKNVFHYSGLVLHKCYYIDNTQLNEITTLSFMEIENPGEDTDTDEKLNLGQGQ